LGRCQDCVADFAVGGHIYMYRSCVGSEVDLLAPLFMTDRNPTHRLPCRTEVRIQSYIITMMGVTQTTRAWGTSASLLLRGATLSLSASTHTHTLAHTHSAPGASLSHTHTNTHTHSLTTLLAGGTARLHQCRQLAPLEVVLVPPPSGRTKRRVATTPGGRTKRAAGASASERPRGTLITAGQRGRRGPPLARARQLPPLARQVVRAARHLGQSHLGRQRGSAGAAAGAFVLATFHWPPER
jgi:hypothetical protein